MTHQRSRDGLQLRKRAGVPGHLPRSAAACLRLVVVAAAVAGFGDARAQTPPAIPQGSNYVVDRHTIDGGGGRSSGGTYEIQGTIGQPDADPLQPSSGGVYEITGGFWPGLGPAPPRPDPLFANGFE